MWIEPEIEFVNERAVFQIPDVRDVYVDLYSKNFSTSPRDFSERNANPSVMVAVYRTINGTIVGFSRFFFHMNNTVQPEEYSLEYTIKGICFSGTVVQSSYRGRGIGTRLISRVISFATEFTGAKYAIVCIDASNTIPLHMFQKYGFHPCKTICNKVTKDPSNYYILSKLIAE